MKEKMELEFGYMGKMEEVLRNEIEEVNEE